MRCEQLSGPPCSLGAGIDVDGFLEPLPGAGHVVTVEMDDSDIKMGKLVFRMNFNRLQEAGFRPRDQLRPPGCVGKGHLKIRRPEIYPGISVGRVQFEVLLIHRCRLLVELDVIEQVGEFKEGRGIVRMFPDMCLKLPDALHHPGIVGIFLRPDGFRTLPARNENDQGHHEKGGNPERKLPALQRSDPAVGWRGSRCDVSFGKRRPDLRAAGLAGCYGRGVLLSAVWTGRRPGTFSYGGVKDPGVFRRPPAGRTELVARFSGGAARGA